MKCDICGKDCKEKLCEWHKISYDQLNDLFKYYQEIKDISWNDYLKEVIDNRNSGIWVKEVASYILKKES